jgi:voltage-gated sodium channel
MKTKKRAFGDTEEMQENLKRILDEFANDELHSYHDGLIPRLLKSDWFKRLMFGIILLGSLWVGIDTDLNKQDAPPNLRMMINVVDNLICLFFTSEIILRLSAFKNKRDALLFGSFVFDFAMMVCVVMGTWMIPLVQYLYALSRSNADYGNESSALRILRVLRLVRIARIGRLVSAWPDLVILCNGMTVALRKICSTICLLVVIQFIFAVIFTELLSNTDAEKHNFTSVYRSMIYLLAEGIFDDQSPIIYALLEIHWFYFVLIMIYIVLADLTLMNMVVGVVIRVVSSVADAESAAKDVVMVRDQLFAAMRKLDLNHNATISLREFQHAFDQPEMVHAMHELGIDVIALQQDEDVIFNEPNVEVGYEDVVMGLMKFRGTNVCTVKDVMDLRLHVKNECKQLESRLRQQQLPRRQGTR